MVYIYGGGFQSGGAGCPIYDGEAMANKEIVFVSINYRVGPFGFFAHPELSAESPSGTSGNYGILDMIAALQWVKDNITSFGGDPDNVTIAGQSAGSFGVNFLCASPLAEGLFHKAIGQSGASFYSGPLRMKTNKETAEEMGKLIMEQLGATSISEMRSMPAEKIHQIQNILSRPYQDGYVLVQSIYDTYASGNQNDVPLMIGWNAQDVVNSPQDSTTFTQYITTKFGDMEEEFYAVYPMETEKMLMTSQLEMNRDEIFGLQVYTWGKMQNNTGNSDVYMYNFNRQIPAHNP